MMISNKLNCDLCFRLLYTAAGDTYFQQIHCKNSQENLLLICIHVLLLCCDFLMNLGIFNKIFCLSPKDSGGLFYYLAFCALEPLNEDSIKFFRFKLFVSKQRPSNLVVKLFYQFFFSSIFMLICLSYFPLRSETQVDTRCLSRFNHTSIMCVWLECLVRGYLKYSIL